MYDFDLVIFDCDGVLVDSEPITNMVYVEMLNELGLSMTLENALECFMGKSMIENLRDITEMLDREPPSDFTEQFQKRATAALHAQLLPVDGVQELLSKLPIPFYLASNSEHVKIRTTLGITGLLPFFEERIISSMDVPRPKPFPDVYLLAAQRFGVQPLRCAVIEDTPTGATAGAAAGMCVFGYSKYMSADRLRAAGAAVTFDDMRELARLLVAEHPDFVEE